MKKHAYLIMVHNNFYCLEKLLLLLDNEKNDIFIHVDNRVSAFDFDYFKNLIKKSTLTFTKRLNVYWGSAKIAEAMFVLLEEATKKDKYHYYHLLSGADLPLKSQKEIHDYLENKNDEFISFANSFQFVRLPLIAKKENLSRNTFKIARFGYLICESFRRLFRINRFKKLDFEIKKGPNWFSITDKLARYAMSKKETTLDFFKEIINNDEFIIQTIAYNSEFKDNISLEEGNLRYIDWTRGKPYTFKKEDFDELINCNKLFARKFDQNQDKEIIDKIFDYLTKKE